MLFLRLAVVLLLTVIMGHGLNPAVVTAAEYKTGEVLVQLRDTTRSAALVEHRERSGMRLRRSMAKGRLLQLSLPEGLSVADAVAQLSADPEVMFVEPNYILEAQTMPDDPQFDLQWGLYNSGQTVNGYAGTPGADIDAVSAWDLAANGSEIIVAVVDTGVTLNHPDLEERLWTNPDEIAGNTIDDDHNGYVDDILGWDMVDNDPTPWDPSGHGTHVAGIIAAQYNNTLGISGTAPLARIMAVRFMDAFDQGTVAGAIAAIEYALAQGARIINCSWGTSSYSTALRQTMAEANALFVCAAGNMGADNDIAGFYPAAFDLDNVLSVAAVDPMDQLAWFSNYGRHTVDVAAPGIGIYGLDSGLASLWQETFESSGIPEWTVKDDSESDVSWEVRPLPFSPGESALTFVEEQTYANDIDTWAQMPVFDLSDLGAAQLSFKVIGASRSEDVLSVEVSRDGSTWLNRAVYYGGRLNTNGISGVLPYWTTVTVDLGGYDETPELIVRLHFRSDAVGTDKGFYVDDLVLKASAGGDTYRFMNGTSMAAAFVSGVGALVLSLSPDLSIPEIKAKISAGVDPNPALDSLVISGGRVNAFKALTVSPDAFNTRLDDSAASGGSGGSNGGCFIAILCEK